MVNKCEDFFFFFLISQFDTKKEHIGCFWLILDKGGFKCYCKWGHHSLSLQLLLWLLAPQLPFYVNEREQSAHFQFLRYKLMFSLVKLETKRFMLVLEWTLHISEGRKQRGEVCVPSSCNITSRRGSRWFGPPVAPETEDSTMRHVSLTQFPSTVGWELTSLIMSLYGVKYHIALIMLKNRVHGAERDYWLLSPGPSSFQLQLSIRRRTLNEVVWFVREISWNPLRPPFRDAHIMFFLSRAGGGRRFSWMIYSA